MKLTEMSNPRILIILIAVVALTAGIELLMGRTPWCTCGYIKFWHGVVYSSENSQHLTDWYTFTHIIHGFGFYLLLQLVAKRLPRKTRLIIAVMLEAAWEILENSSYVINRYRTATISLDYYGDSVVNSLTDIIAMVFGFSFAAKMPTWVTITAFICIELVLLYFIRDNLTINIIMLIYPIRALKLWQAGN